MPTYKQRKETFELYSRLPDEVSDARKISIQDWLINNGETYTHAATALAYSVEEAYVTLQEKRAGHGRKARFATVHLPQRLQALGPGDVLIEGEQAWMIMADERVEQISYDASHPWRFYGQRNQINCVTWSPDGAYLVAGDSGSQVRIHALMGGKKKSRSTPLYDRHKNWTVYAVAWSPDGWLIASGGYHRWGSNHSVEIWQPEMDMVLLRLDQHDGSERSMTV